MIKKRQQKAVRVDRSFVCNGEFNKTAVRTRILAWVVLLSVAACLLGLASPEPKSTRYVIAQHAPAALHSKLLPSLQVALHISQDEQHHHQQKQQHEQERSEWDTHIIFDGSNDGKLHECPSDSSAWLEGTWLSPAAAVDAQIKATDSRSLAAGFMLPHSATAQQMIWRHQRPKDCSTAKFLLYNGPVYGKDSHGIGSIIHLETAVLAIAMSAGRVLVEIPGTYLASDPYCGDHSTLDTCYFRSLTHCKITPEQIRTAYQLNGTSKSSDHAMFNAQNWTAVEALGQFIVADKWFPQRSWLWRHIPLPFQQLVQDSGIPEKNLFYYWRAQAAAYIVRPNNQVLQEIALRKRDKLRGLPLSAGCVSVFIRHGDKHTESKTFEDPAYEAGLDALRSISPKLTRQVFLSTEDPATVAYFTNASRKWSTSYVDMPRKPNRSKSNLEYMKEHGFAEEMLDGLLNLDLALQCDGFVSSMNSNWARLIDELRSTVRCKAQARYMDVEFCSPKGIDFVW